MKITFWGAAQQVTGSMFLVETEDEYKILIDCGMDMESGTEADPIYPGSNLPFDAPMINVAILTHAHLDHSGRLPNLVKEGFEGQVLSTSPTFALSSILLRDSASINERKVRSFFKGRKTNPERFKDFDPEVFYLEEDVEETIDRFVPIAFEKTFKINKTVRVTLIPTGHLLGAANVFLEVKEQGEWKSILFSGDIGRKNYPLIPDPKVPPQADYVVMETTYGQRLHQELASSTKDLERIVKETCVDQPGRLIIPAFSIGRTQAIIYTLNRLMEEGQLPFIKIFADSPMAQTSNMVHEQAGSYLNQEAKEFKKEHGSLFNFDHISYPKTVKESKAISDYTNPCIIISSSGMMDAGRIQYHVGKNIENAYCTILYIGYMGENTFGRRLLESGPTVSVGGKLVQKRATIEKTDSFSGHGDQQDLLDFAMSQDKEKLTKVFLVHGEVESQEVFKDLLLEKGIKEVECPAKGTTYVL